MNTVTLVAFIAVILRNAVPTLAKTGVRQKRTWIIEEFQIDEEHPGPYPYELGSIDIDPNYHIVEIHGKGVDEEPLGVFHLDEHNGKITVNHKIDYEEYHNFLLVFEAKNKSSASTDMTRLGIKIDINNINDEAPRFEKSEYLITLKESTFQELIAIVKADDMDQPSNIDLEYNVVSVTPKTNSVNFFINKNKLFFSGCLNYQEVKKYTVEVQATDAGEPKLRGTCKYIINVLDENNHLPTFSSAAQIIRVKEKESVKALLRVQAMDRDSNDTAAWRAKYTIHGDKGQHFEIATDPVSNEGVLSLVKPLDFKQGAVRNLSVSVENEAPFFSCVVKERPSKQPWMLDTVNLRQSSGGAPKPHHTNVTVMVEDVKDPPEFLQPIKRVTVDEDVKPGYLLGTFTAVDLDTKLSMEFVYAKSQDPADWVEVNPKTCEIHTAKRLDRESEFVIKDIYTVLIHAVSKDKPPLTGTATLNIHLRDQNDNVPQLSTNNITMCMGEGPISANITAYDPDGDPYGGPFQFELLEDVRGKWRLDPTYGTTVTLVKENPVYTGLQKFQLKISDQQGEYSLQNLTVTVCECSSEAKCRTQRATSSRISAGAIAVIFTILLLMLGTLVLSIFLLRGQENTTEIFPPDYQETLLQYNTETPGDDCKVTGAAPGTQVQIRTTATREKWISMQDEKWEILIGGQHKAKYAALSQRERAYRLLLQKINRLQAPGKELCNYTPKAYAYEGELGGDPQLDTISISEEDFQRETLLDLGPRFTALASVCRTGGVPHGTDVSHWPHL